MRSLYFVLLTMSPAGHDKYTEIVYDGYLVEISDFANIGLIFDNYKWFEEFAWSSREEKDGHMVTFKGIVPDAKAVEDFHINNQYNWRLSFKAMQLSEYYGLDKDKTKLSLTVNFFIKKGGRLFVTHSGSLGILSQKNGTWRQVALSDKSLLTVIEGIYTNQNPYVSLVLGLPYK